MNKISTFPYTSNNTVEKIFGNQFFFLEEQWCMWLIYIKTVLMIWMDKMIWYICIHICVYQHIHMCVYILSNITQS